MSAGSRVALPAVVFRLLSKAAVASLEARPCESSKVTLLIWG
jgi:hypothetical protein